MPLPKIETDHVSLLEGDLLERMKVAVTAKQQPAKGPSKRKGALRDDKSRLFFSRSTLSKRQKSELGEPKLLDSVCMASGQEPNYRSRYRCCATARP